MSIAMQAGAFALASTQTRVVFPQRSSRAAAHGTRRLSHFRVRAESEAGSKTETVEVEPAPAPAAAAAAASVPPLEAAAPPPPPPPPAPPASAPAAAEAAAPAKKVSPLEKGGTLSGKEAAGKAPAATTLGASPKVAVVGEKFSDPRWSNGTWDLAQFTKDGKVDWDGVIDAEVVRRQWLEENPQSSSNDDKVLFDTATIPWWAWVRRFHLPEAEKLNGRAAMVGFFAAYVVDAATGVGLVDQSDSFLGKLLLFLTIVGVLLIRRNEDVTNLKELVEESTFYDRQWQAAWKEGPPPANSEEGKE